MERLRGKLRLFRLTGVSGVGHAIFRNRVLWLSWSTRIVDAWSGSDAARTALFVSAKAVIAFRRANLLGEDCDLVGVDCISMSFVLRLFYVWMFDVCMRIKMKQRNWVAKDLLRV